MPSSTQAAGTEIVGMMSLEMIGYTTDEFDFIDL